MTKKYLFSSLAALALGFVVSCDNTTDDPPNQNKTTTGDNAITGPRILAKINNGTKELKNILQVEVFFLRLLQEMPVLITQ